MRADERWRALCMKFWQTRAAMAADCGAAVLDNVRLHHHCNKCEIWVENEKIYFCPTASYRDLEQLKMAAIEMAVLLILAEPEYVKCTGCRKKLAPLEADYYCYTSQLHADLVFKIINPAAESEAGIEIGVSKWGEVRELDLEKFDQNIFKRDAIIRNMVVATQFSTDKIEDIAEEAIEAIPSDRELLEYLPALIELGAFAHAESLAKAYVRENRFDADGYAFLAETITSLFAEKAADITRLSEAKHFAEQALQLNPNHLRAKMALANSVNFAGDANLAINYFESILEHAPDYLPARFNLATTLLNIDTEMALAHFEHGANADPDDGDFLLGIARAHLRMGDKNNARKALKAAKKLLADDDVVAELECELGADTSKLTNVINLLKR
jgi:tetratricopeptide (TPR) repeat protein